MTAAALVVGWAGMGRLAGDHLWQSTVFAALAGLLTLAFRNHRAQVRYGLWLAASLKFLVPFAALVALGGLFGRRDFTPAPLTEAPMTLVMDTVSQPFTQLAVAPAATSHYLAATIPALLLAVWLCGCAAVMALTWLRWRRISAAVREAQLAQAGRELDALRRVTARMGMTRPVALALSDAGLEPGVVGIWNPVLLWPRGITEHLSDAQVEAILAHEVAHLRRRDNMAAATHMLVETFFWFHPLVWWLGKQMVEERERACDEEVLGLGSEPQVYAEGILTICEVYLESPIACVAGVTGADLKKRMERIMRNRAGETLRGWRKYVLAAAGAAALAVPIVAGVLTTPRLGVQEHPPDPKYLPRFEVASVKPSDPGAQGGALTQEPGGRYTIRNITLERLIAPAFELKIPFQFRMTGGPDWMRSERWDIEAKGAGNPTRQQMHWMLQALLVDRFKLRTHYEIRQEPVYALVVSKSGTMGPQLHFNPDNTKCIGDLSAPPPGPAAGLTPGEANPPCSIIGVPTKQIGKKITMQALAEDLTMFVDRVIVDRTGLEGNFDFDLEFSPFQQPAAGFAVSTGSGFNIQQGQPAGLQPAGAGAPDTSGLPSIFTAVQEQLGLKLEPQTGPVDVLVIDSAERPTPN